MSPFVHLLEQVWVDMRSVVSIQGPRMRPGSWPGSWASLHVHMLNEPIWVQVGKTDPYSFSVNEQKAKDDMALIIETWKAIRS